MKKSKLTESQIISMLNEGQAGLPIADLCRKYAVSSATYYKLKNQYAGMSVSKLRRLKKRNTYGADQNMLNWSAWLRMHTRDPEWTPHVIQEDAASIMDFS